MAVRPRSLFAHWAAGDIVAEGRAEPSPAAAQVAAPAPAGTSREEAEDDCLISVPRR